MSIVFLGAIFIFGVLTCLVHGWHYLYPLLFSFCRGKGKRWALSGWLVCGGIAIGVMITIATYIMPFAAPYPYFEKGIMFVVCLYTLLRKEEEKYYFSSKAPLLFKKSLFMKGFLLSVDMWIRGGYLLFYTFAIVAVVQKKWQIPSGEVIAAGLGGVVLAFFILGKSKETQSPYGFEIKKSYPWRWIQLGAFLAGLGL